MLLEQTWLGQGLRFTIAVGLGLAIGYISVMWGVGTLRLLGGAAALSGLLLMWRPRWGDLALVAVAASILGPNMNVISGLPLIRIEQVIVGMLWVAFLYQHPFLGDRSGRTNETMTVVLRLMALWAVIIVASAARGVFIGYPLDARDATELIWPFAYYVVPVVIADAVQSRWITVSSANAVLSGAFGASAFVGILQFLDVPLVNQYISPLYLGTAERQAHLLSLIQSSRVYGTAGNPNLFGVLMAMGLVFSLARLLNQERRGFFSLLLFTLCGVALILTLSRTSIVAAVLALLYVVGRKLLSGRSQIRTTVVLGLVVVVASATFLYVESLYLRKGNSVYDGFATRLYGLVSFATSDDLDEDLNRRLAHWDRLLADGIGAVGVGPTKAVIGRVADSEYVLVLRRYGLIGLGIYLLFFIAMARSGNRLSWAETGREERALGLALEGTVVVVLFAALTNAVFYSTQVMGVLLIMFGLVAGSLVHQRRLGET